MRSAKSAFQGNGPTIRRGSTKLVIGLALVVAAVAVGAFVMFTDAASNDDVDDRFILKTAEVGPFRITITENGTVDSLQNATLKNSVEGTTTIIGLVPEGSKVNSPVKSEFAGTVEFVDTESEAEKSIKVIAEDGMEQLYTFTLGEFGEVLVEDGRPIRKGEYIAGDIVVELDSSSLVEKEKQLQIDVTTARANLETAEKNLEIQATTNESNLAKAKLDERLAELDFRAYTAEGGQYQNDLDKLTGTVKNLEELLATAQEAYEKSRDLARRGYEDLTVLEQKRIAVTKGQIDLDAAKSELFVLTNFTKIRQEAELQQKAEDSVRETERVRLEGEAAMAGQTATRDAMKLTLSVEEENHDKVKTQIAACRLVAPQQGEVVYASQQSRRSEPVVIEEGATVRERQDIINLPDLEQMKIDARIHESRISRIVIGQPVEISIDALPSIAFRGTLETVSSVTVPGQWPNTDLKEYEAVIRITDAKDKVRQLKPGMTAEIRIIVDDREEDVLQIPVQSVISIVDHYYAYVANKGDIEKRKLTVGDANDEYMEILDGLREGDRVVMNPRTHFSREINELEVELLNEAELKREKVKVPGRGPGRGQAGAGGGRPGKGGPGGGKGRPGAGGGRPTAAQIMAGTDKNKDGVITKDESDLGGKFDQADKDGDGKLTEDELKAALSGAGGGRG